jgi:putative transposase
MPNHVHLLICPNQPEYYISSILASIKQSTARRALNYLREENPAGLKHLSTGQPDSPYRFWQDGGGYDRNINNPETILKTIRYIHANPVRKGLVEAPQEWYYSSAATWQKPGTGPLSVDFDTWPIP